MKNIFKCPKCGKYTMKEKCPNCNSTTKNPKPARFSPKDRMGKYRRKAKEPKLKKEGLI